MDYEIWEEICYIIVNEALQYTKEKILGDADGEKSLKISLIFVSSQGSEYRNGYMWNTMIPWENTGSISREFLYLD